MRAGVLPFPLQLGTGSMTSHRARPVLSSQPAALPLLPHSASLRHSMCQPALLSPWPVHTPSPAFYSRAKPM
jgi:hypothetical protein